MVLLLYFFIPFAGISRDIFSVPPMHDQHADQDARMVSFGMFRGDFTGLNNFISRSGSFDGFNPFFKTVGLDVVIPSGTRQGEHKGTMNFEFILPQQTSMDDSVKFRMLGWHIISSIWSYDILKENQKLALEIAPGVDWGELYVKHTIKNAGEFHYHNPFIAPLARAEFRVVLPPFAFGLRAVYRYDISSPHWKSNSSNESIFVNSRISGLGFQVFFGWGKIAKDYSK